MKILIYGAGVIGCHYAVWLHKAGNDVSLFARGNRLAALKQHGLQYLENGQINIAHVTIVEELSVMHRYDYIFLTVREEQLKEALTQLKNTNSSTIVTMVNTIDVYEDLEELCGKGRLLPAFPGAGGSITNGILDAGFTPAWIQPTTFGEVNGAHSPRVKDLKRMFKTANIACQVVADMHAWQICHLALVVPLADAYYNTLDPKNAGKDKAVMKKTARQLIENFRTLHTNGLRITPLKLNFFRYCPHGLLRFVLSIIYQSAFAEKYMYQHSINAKAEMRALHKQLSDYFHNGYST